MGLSESSLNTITKPFSFSFLFFNHIVKYHVVVHVVLNHVVMKITITIVMSIPMNLLIAMKKNKYNNNKHLSKY